jgi:transcriptional regulator GlxA family with amidase domain
MTKRSQAACGSASRAQEARRADDEDPRQHQHGAHGTERTLERRCQQHLGLSFTDWRQRLRVVKALAMLETGRSVEAVGLD